MSNVRKCNDKNTAVILGTPYRDSKRTDFRSHVSSLFRFTYRKDFTALHPYPISSDAGWGCMLRSAQMMMACALQRHLLGKDWRRSENINILRASTQYCDILKWFSDFPGPPHMYSIHHLVQCGMRYDKLPGEWFGPSTAALVLRDLTRLHRSKYGGTLEVLVTQGDTIYIRDCEDLCTSIATADKKDTGSAVKGMIKNNHSDNGHHVSSGRTFGGGDERSSMDSAEGVLLNSVSEDDTMFSNCNDGSNTSAAADFVRSSSSLYSSYPDNANCNSKAIGLQKEKVLNASLTQQSEGSIHTLFDPLFNPPPSHTAPWGCSLVVCIPLRLGISSVSSEYIEELKELLRHPNCVGFVGGRVNHAIYFVGYKVVGNGATELLGLDPHSVYSTNQETPFPSAELVSQVHVSELDSLDASRLDPSLALAFYFKDRQDFEYFCDETRSNVDRKRNTGITPLFCVEHSAPSYGSHCWSGDDHGDDDEGEDNEEDEYVLV